MHGWWLALWIVLGVVGFIGLFVLAWLHRLAGHRIAEAAEARRRRRSEPRKPEQKE